MGEIFYIRQKDKNGIKHCPNNVNLGYAYSSREIAKENLIEYAESDYNFYLVTVLNPHIAASIAMQYIKENGIDKLVRFPNETINFEHNGTMCSIVSIGCTHVVEAGYIGINAISEGLVFPSMVVKWNSQSDHKIYGSNFLSLCDLMKKLQPPKEGIYKTLDEWIDAKYVIESGRMITDYED